ncbi:MAG TPA: hypothetical protein VN840_19580 [Streptosporangiaceae bacterium]|nr:hypothetical protein [Streptosporangiaceae bacterium]
MLLTALKSAEQEVLGTTSLPCRPGQNPGHDEQASQAAGGGVIAHRCRVMLTWAQGKNPVHEGLALAEVAPGVVIPAERRGQRKRPGVLPGVQTVIQRGAQVDVMAADPPHPGALLRQAD